LKSENILIEKYTYFAKIADLGCSFVYNDKNISFKDIDKNDSNFLIKTINHYGTMIFNAPESLFDKLYHKKSDVYSFGSIIFEILTHEIPWKYDGIDGMNEIDFKNLVKDKKYPTIDLESIKLNDQKNIDFLIFLCENCWNPNFDERFSFSFITNLLKIYLNNPNFDFRNYKLNENDKLLF
jgi:serine/threonine protein kinase